MSAEDRVRAVLVQAAKNFENAWHAAYHGKAADDWHLAARQNLDRAVAEARDLMQQHAEELGSTAALFEKTRISKLYEEYDSAVHRLRTVRTPGPADSPKEKRRERTPNHRAEHRNRRKHKARRADWDQPASYSKIIAADLQGMAGPGDGADHGLTFDCYDDGQVRCITLWQDGAAAATLKLWPGQARARYEDSANVAEFLPSGVVEEYGGRYEREELADKTFRQWVLDKLQEMSS